MTDALRTAAQAALAVLEDLDGERIEDSDGHALLYLKAEIKALKAALAQPEPEPEPVALSSTMRSKPVRFEVHNNRVIYDDDFIFDAVLKVSGDFSDAQRAAYLQWVCDALNAAAQPEQQAKQPDGWVLRTGQGDHYHHGPDNPKPDFMWMGKPAWHPVKFINQEQK